MKKLIIIIALILFATQAFAGNIVIAKKKAGAGASCQAVAFYDTSSGSSSTNMNGNYTADQYYAGAIITPSVTKDVCKMEIRVSRPYSATPINYYAVVYTMNGTALDAVQGTSSPTSMAQVTEQLIAFNFSTPVTMTASTAYGVAVYGATQSEDNIVKVFYKSDGDDDSARQWKSDKTRNDNTTAQIMVKFYAYE